jgi:solute carrier family 35 protein E1
MSPALLAPLVSTRASPRGRVPSPPRAIVRARACIPACWISRETTKTPAFISLNTRPLFPTSARAHARRPTAAATATAAVTSERSPVPVKTLILGVLFAGWYACNIVFNICNKQVLGAYPFPLTSTLWQFAAGVAFMALLQITGIHRLNKDSLTMESLKAIAPLAIVHTLGNVLTNVSLGKVAVSFTHTIKAMEPFFSVLLSSLFLGDVPSAAVIATLVPIVGGVAAASVTEASFNWPGFLAAMVSFFLFSYWQLE